MKEMELLFTLLLVSQTRSEECYVPGQCIGQLIGYLATTSDGACLRDSGGAVREWPAMQPYYWKSRILDDRWNILCFHHLTCKTFNNKAASQDNQGGLRETSWAALPKQPNKICVPAELCKSWQQLLDFENMLYPWAYYASTPYLLLWCPPDKKTSLWE